MATSTIELPDAVAAALAEPGVAEPGIVAANEIPFAIRAWGDPVRPPLLLIHGVTASSRVWWRLGPALAAGLERRVVAVDQAGHGRTVAWAGHHLLADNASDLVAFARAAGLDRPDLRVVGHSWGAATAAWFPATGLRPEVLVLLEPPAISAAALATMLVDPIERHYDDLDEAIRAIGALYPTWGYGDVIAKAEGLTQFDVEAVRTVLTLNGDWDGGLTALGDPAAASAVVRLIRGDPASGGLIPDEAAAALRRLLGEANVITIRGGSHSPMRQLAERTTLELLRALEPA